MGRTCKIDTHNFLIVWVLFCHQIPILSYTFITWKMHRFSHQFPIAQENSTKHMGRTQVIGTYTFPEMSFFPYSSHPMVYSIKLEMQRVFSSTFNSTGICNKTHHMRKTWEIELIICPQYRCFFPSDSYPMVYFTIW